MNPPAARSRSKKLRPDCKDWLDVTQTPAEERPPGRLKPTARYELVGRLFVLWGLGSGKEVRDQLGERLGVNRPVERPPGRLTPTARHQLVGRLFLRRGLSFQTLAHPAL